MRILALDASTEWLAVAAGDAGRCVELRERAGQAHSERALPLVAAALARLDWPLASLDAIAFGAGPGSFTGVRIACGVAQGLALGSGVPLVPVPTLEAIAEEAWARHGATAVFACLDARMREVYVAAYRRGDEGWASVLAPAVCGPDALALPPGAWFGAGPGLAAYPALAARLDLAGMDAAVRPSARAVLALALPAFAAGRGVEPEAALPLYVRHRVALTAAERTAGATL